MLPVNMVIDDVISFLKAIYIETAWPFCERTNLHSVLRVFFEVLSYTFIGYV